MARPKKEAPAKKVNYGDIPRLDTNELLDSLQAKLGGDGVVLQRGEEIEGRFDLRRPSGIIQLDAACGGGLPAGGLSQIDGLDGIGKNLLLNHYLANQQRIHKEKANLGMVCLEGAFDKLFARAVGVKVALSNYEIEAIGRERHLKGQPELTSEEADDFREQIGNFHVFRGAAAEKILEGVVDWVACNSYQIIGIDSWDAMLTIAEENKELEDNAKVADASNVQTRWMRKVFGALSPQKICPECFSRPLAFKIFGKGGYTYKCGNSDCSWEGQRPYMWENETTIIGLRQVRANLKQYGHAREYKTTGAYALRHGKMIDIQLRKGKPITVKDKDVGKEITWELTKGKAGTHEGHTGSYSYYFNPPQIDVTADLENYCITNNIITYGGSKVGFLMGEMKLGSKEEMQRRIEEDNDFQSLLRIEAIKFAGQGHIRYK
ncbi:DNA recombination and repair protein RecA [uncultured Caudovirales phage]|uniref:DNA recombination and repair protein RecA n=1 Tax=uncultured Caudovirales phage TaxID=2100421 RepID=A0A6J5LDT9_9CAUD|nr:DNA recombination and repair protein RecA [uncultured Caudovirales phage]CAB4135144.1 DNA recombination and repair protein RecA [uncultured Caudovirales phage]